MKHSINRINLYSDSFGLKDDEIDLKEFFRTLIKGRWIILLFMLCFSILSMFIAINRPVLYQSDILLFDSDNQSSADLLGLQNLMGFSLSSEKNVNAKIAIEMMTSKSFISDFIKKYHLMIPVMATVGWDRESNKLLIDENKYDTKNKVWVKKNKTNKPAEPNDFELHEKFLKSFFSIKQNAESYFYTVSIKHYSPFIAKEIAENLIAEIYFRMRARAIGEAERNLNYLQAQLNKTSVAEMKISIYTLITEQTKTLMLAEAKEYYAFEVLDPPLVSENSISHKVQLTTVLGALFGIFCGSIFTLVFFYFKDENK